MNEDNRKFGRQYILKVETQPRKPGSTIPEDASFATIQLPYTVEFSISRNLLGSANTGSFRIYNLAERSRNRIYQDAFSIFEFRAVQFWAGYSNQPPMLFNGNVKKAWSYRQSGNKDIFTEIEAYEGAYAMINGFSNKTIAAGQNFTDVIKSLTTDLPFLDNAIIGDVSGTTKRGTTLFGNTWKLTQQYSGGNAAIDNNKLLVLQPNECIPGDLTVINSQSGLLGSPYRCEHVVELEMVFTPQLKIGQIVRLESESNRLFDGYYKVTGLRHCGMISPSVGGSVRTTVQLFLGTGALTIVR